MVREFELPDVGEGVAEGELLRWRVEPGDAVSEDQPVAEVETDKAVVDVPSPVDGVVEELRAAEGEMVPVGDVIIVFRVDGEDGPKATETAPADDTTAGSGQQTEVGATAQPAEGQNQRLHSASRSPPRRLCGVSPANWASIFPALRTRLRDV